MTTRFRSSAGLIAGCVLLQWGGICSMVAAQYPYGGASVVAPNWQPMQGFAGARPATAVMKTTGATNVAGGSPYYTNAPQYQGNGFYSFVPQASLATPPVMAMPTSLPISRPTIVPDQLISPMVQTPTGLVPGAVAPTPIPTTPSAPAPVATFAPPVIPSAPLAATAPPVVPVTPTPPAPTPTPPATPTQPLVDPNVFVPGAQNWLDIDISPYVSRFPAASGAEKSVREWILRKFDPSTWTGGQVSSLVVTPERVRVYHTPSVHQQVRDLLGRFIYYTPGEFQTQVRVLAVQDSRWRSTFGSALLPAGTNGTQGRLWTVAAVDAKEMIDRLGTGQRGSMLTNPDALAMNGQALVIDWSPRVGFKSDPQGVGRPTEDGVLIKMSPLIESDAATVELDLAGAVRRTALARESFWRADRGAAPGVVQYQTSDLVKLAPGQVALLSLGEVPSFDEGRGLFGREKSSEILVFVACTPSARNTVNGRPVEIAQWTGFERTVAARPGAGGLTSPRSDADRRLPSRRGELASVPQELTQPVD